MSTGELTGQRGSEGSRLRSSDATAASGSRPMPLLAPVPSNAISGLENNLWALWSRFGHGEGCRLHDEAEALWYETPVAALPYNGVLRFAAAQGAEAVVDRIFACYRQRGVPFVWIVHPSATPPDLDGMLRARGFEEAEVADGMWVDLATLDRVDSDPAGIVIREATPAERLDHLLELVRWRWDVPAADSGALRRIAAAFDADMPGNAVRCWIAWQGRTPVAKALLNVAAGAAGLYGVATAPAARGLGLARTLTLRALEAARREGCRLGVLHATPMARSLYVRLGFQSVARFRIFAPRQGM